MQVVRKLTTSTDLVQASKLIVWNRRFIGFLGLWPSKVNQPVFMFVVIYMIIYCIMGARHLIKNFNYPERVVANLTDNVLFAMILGKMFILRGSCGIMTKFLKSIEIDFSTEMYNNVQEKMAYLYYNEIAIIFLKFSTFMAGLAASLYYLKTFIKNWSAFHPFFEITDTTTYVCFCLYLSICIPIIVCGYSAPDAYVLSLTLHVCGQLATLSCKINNLLKDQKNYQHHVGNIVVRHRHLIRLADTLENKFNLIFLQQTLGTTFLLCVTLYHMLATSENGENYNVLAFVSYIICVISTILAYCYIGECLITESSGLRDAFYNTDWYNNPPRYTKLISICMIRAERPLLMTAGKFCALSLNTFTSIVKTSMAYLSVLRNFM